MAHKQRRKRSWLRTLLFYLLFPLIVWFVAFVLWFYWHDLTKLFNKSVERAKPPAKVEPKTERTESAKAAPAKRPAEKILNEDRKKLEDILKQRQ